MFIYAVLILLPALALTDSNDDFAAALVSEFDRNDNLELDFCEFNDIPNRFASGFPKTVDCNNIVMNINEQAPSLADFPSEVCVLLGVTTESLTLRQVFIIPYDVDTDENESITIEEISSYIQPRR